MIDPIASLSFLPLQLSRNVVEHVIEAVDPGSAPDRSVLSYFLRIDVPEFPQSPTLVELTTMEGREKPPVTVGGATTYEGAFFSIEQILDGFLSLQKPQFRQAMISAIASLTMPYRLAQIIQPLNTVVNCPVKWIIKAGLNDIDFAGWGDRFFDVYQGDARRFLTWQPDRKLVAAEQEEYLYFLMNCSPLPLVTRIRLEVFRTDGLLPEATTLMSIQNVLQNQVLCLPVGPAVLGIDLTNVVEYRIWLANENNERISEVRTYEIDQRYRRTERCILFSNSLGGYDTLRLLGSGLETFHVDRTLAERERPAGAGADFSELYVIDTLGERTLTIQSGYVERDDLRTLKYWDEVLLSQEWYLVTDAGHVPLELVTTDLVDGDDEADLIARTFTFRHVAAETNYSLLPPAPPTKTRPTAWRGAGLLYLLDGFGKRLGLARPVRLQKYYLDDSTLVKPLVEKPNTPGDPDYIPPRPVPGVAVGSSPFLNVAISRAGSYKRATCPNGQQGGEALITVAAGKYGGETQEDADNRAEAEFVSLDTQAFADSAGTCSLSETYDWAVPANQWHMRLSVPGQIAIFHTNGVDGPADMGNDQSLQNSTGPFVYPSGTADMNFPIGDLNWYFYTYGSPGQAKRVRVYKNSVLQYDLNVILNGDGYERFALCYRPGGNIPVLNGEKWYIKYENQ
ncbi:DUF5977 domain-containing protein [Spirosoma rigui]|uniref:DUF5977 domain-containing protein n=1 Tax=Spirosoma rigui TaxID=564064 RepID=UPI0009B179D5|nr:DUF5977 domain-containing protein [Spirosoma rigui]